MLNGQAGQKMREDLGQLEPARTNQNSGAEQTPQEKVISSILIGGSTPKPRLTCTDAHGEAGFHSCNSPLRAPPVPPPGVDLVQCDRIGGGAEVVQIALSGAQIGVSHPGLDGRH